MTKYNAYGKGLELTEDEQTIYAILFSIGRIKEYWHDDRNCFPNKIKYIGTKSMKSSHQILELTKLSLQDYNKAMYHLLINGIVEKIYLDKERYFYRIPLVKE